MELSDQTERFKKELGKKVGGVVDKVDEYGDKFADKVDEAKEYLDQGVEELKERYRNIPTKKKKAFQRGAIGLGVTVIAPWYIAIPAAVYTYKQGKKIFQKK